MIKHDHSAMRGGDPTKGRAPDVDPPILEQLVDTWFQMWSFDNDLEFAVPGTRIRASWAGSCTRQLAYRLGDVEPSNPVTAADAWNMGLGTLIHEAMGPVFKEAFPGAEVEVKVSMTKYLDSSATVDIILRLPGGRVVLVEMKTVNGMKYKSTATTFRGPPEGPQLPHLQQVAMAGRAVDADEVVLIYLSRENVGKDLAVGVTDTGRFGAQWSFTRAEYELVADQEFERLGWALSMFDKHKAAAAARIVADGPVETEELDRRAGEMAAKVMPRLIEPELGKLVRITNPGTGAWVEDGLHGEIKSTGKAWQCNYCSFQKRCGSDGD